ncbi:protein slowmo [Musca domestica]|uniref:Protein slowmo n=1 Tax=Musca domestica TaxID=7370 RepID=A0A1I8N407_MUSDO|nr:protein slowmo [Musca domestica]XP_005177834.1 protein slowmo [Musca domestica]
MKIWTSEHTFNHPWETVAQAAWRKYPNPMTPSIIGTDVVERKVVDGVLHTHRLVQSKWYLPKWTHKIIGTAKSCFASERSVVDPSKRQMILKTVNLTFCRHISVDEIIYYEPHPKDPTKTLLRQEASVTVHGVPLSHYMEDMVTSNISMNAGKGRLGLEWVIGRINAEVKGIAETAAKSTDDLIMTTRRSLDDMTESARKSMDEISAQAAKHMHI